MTLSECQENEEKKLIKAKKINEQNDKFNRDTEILKKIWS
jgi:hypothetical protein